MDNQEYNEIKYQKNHYGIYCIECVETNTKYIGQTYENFYRRWIFHKWNLKNNENIGENNHKNNFRIINDPFNDLITIENLDNTSYDIKVFNIKQN